jgi:hypothetical protein
LSVVGALIVGAAVGWLGFSGHIPVSHTVFATGAAEVSAARAVQTPGGRHVTLMPVAGGAAAASEVAAAQMASGSKPNILVIFGDDVGQTNISAYSFGVVGYHAEHRSDRQRGHDVHGLLRREQLHRRPVHLHHR